jgi:hypothetical protein
MVKQHSNHDPFEEVKFISPFISSKLSCENECSSPPSLEPKPCPSDHQNIVLDNGQESTSILHNVSLENKNFYAMDALEAPTLESKRKDSTTGMEASLLKPLKIHVQFWSLHSSSRLVPHVFTRTTTIFRSSFANF